MIAELSHFLLILALVIALVQAGTGLALLRVGGDQALAYSLATRRAAYGQLALVTGAFAGLIYLFLVSDFSVITVVQNSHSAKPLIYKIAGTWGNHEGSLLLWVLVLALFGAAVARGTLDPDSHHAKLRDVTVAVHGLLSVGFLLLLIGTSNPFGRLAEPPIDGQDLNPLLQDPALALHPPLLYLGYVGFASTFAFAVAGLLLGRMDRDWARATGRYVLIAWAALTVGIALGSWWAYYELGWGGWWFWDPVENASLMPWLAGTALLHSVHVMAKRQALASWTILLAILTFSLSLLGTFLVRSGVLTSVHAFALDPTRGMFILILIGVTVTGALALYGWRASQPGSMPANPPFAAISREGSLVFNNVLLALACAVVLLGTLYPLALQLLGLPPVSVGPPYFEATVIPLMAPLLPVLAIAPFLPWRAASLSPLMRKLRVPALVVIILSLIIIWPDEPKRALASAGFALGLWVILGTLMQWLERAGYRWSGARKLPAWQQGMTLAHLGVGIMVLGIAGSAAWSSDRILRMAPGDSVAFAGYQVTFKGAAQVQGPNYVADQGILRAGDGDQIILAPEKRWYPVAQMRTTEAAIVFDGWGNLYATLGQPDEANLPLNQPVVTNVDPATIAWSLHLQYHPMIVLIWLGSGVMALGGVWAALDRLFRLGHAKSGRRPDAQAAQPSTATADMGAAE
ncbi:MAG: heme lyase CcmF/NrfE family subunit [Pseudomonadota bacterium]